MNHVALISPVSSAIRALRIFSRPRRRLVAERIDALDHRLVVSEELAIRFNGTGCSYRRGGCQSRSPTVSQAELREAPSHRRPDAVERLHGSGEPVRPRRGSRPRPDLRRLESGEAGRQSHASDWPIHDGEHVEGEDSDKGLAQRSAQASMASVYSQPGCQRNEPSTSSSSGVPSRRWSSAHFVAE